MAYSATARGDDDNKRAISRGYRVLLMYTSFSAEELCTSEGMSWAKSVGTPPYHKQARRA